MKGLLRIYDLDGTLTDSNESHILATKLAFEDFALEFPADFFRQNGEGVRLRDILKDMNLPDEAIQEIREARNRYHIEWLLENAEWLAGAEEVLARQRRARKSIAVVTNSMNGFVDAMHARLGIRDKTDLIITSDTPGIERGKPDPTGLLMVSRLFDINPEQCMFVGDQSFDVMAAQRAKMRSCLIRGPHTHHGDLADYEISHIKDLLWEIA